MARSVITVPVAGTTVFDPNAPVISPPAPTLLNVIAGDQQNSLTWSSSTGALSYNVYFQTVPGVTTASTKITLGNVTSFNHTGLVNGTTYYYRVEAIGSGGGASALSNELSATPTPGAFVNNFSQELNGVDQCGVIASTNYPDFEFQRDEAFTYSFWVFFNGTAGNQQFWDQRIGSGGAGIYISKESNNTASIVFEDDSGNAISAQTIASLTGSQWINVIFTYDGSSDSSGFRIYFNSANQALTLSGGPLTNSTTYGINTFVGSASVNDTSPSVRYLDALIDEVSIFNKALNQTEVDELYNSGTPIDLSQHSAVANLVSWWRMGDAGDTPLIAFDQIGNADITWLNSPTYSSSTP